MSCVLSLVSMVIISIVSQKGNIYLIKLAQVTMNDKFKTVSLDDMIDKYVGKVGTPKRDAFEQELRIELLGNAIKQARRDRNLTQEQLGELVGVQKAQISKIENGAKNARIETILKVFEALGAKISFSVEMNEQKMAF